MVRLVYRGLVRLHPRPFRERAGAEMLWIFDEAASSWGAGALLYDAVLSLFRQWLVRSEVWIWIVASIAGFVPLIIAFGSFLPWDRPRHP